MLKPLLICPALLLAWSACGQEQDLPGPNTLSFDTSHLQVKISMNRAVYFPGEAAEITLEVSNPGPATVVLKPFTASTGCVYGSRKVGDDFKDEPQDLCNPYPVDRTTTMTFEAGEIEQRTYHSYDNLFELGTPFMSGRAVPGKGIYRLNYRYGTTVASTEFTVVSPKLEAKAVARVKDQPYKETPSQEQPQMLKEYVYVFALRMDDSSYICAGQSALVFNNLPLRNADGNFDSRGVTPFKRIVTTAAPVISLTVTADRDENLTIEWTDAAGGRGIQFYREGYPAWLSRTRQH